MCFLNIRKILLFALIPYYSIASEYYQITDQGIQIITDIVLSVKPRNIKVQYDGCGNRDKRKGFNKLIENLNVQIDSVPIEIEGAHKWSVQDFTQYRETLTIIIVENNTLSTIKSFMSRLHRRKERKHFNKYLIVIERVFLSIDWMRYMFDMFWDKLILDVIVMHTDRHRSIQLTTYNPFVSQQFQIYNVTNYLESRTNLYTSKVDNLNGFKLDIHLMPIPVRLEFDNAKDKPRGIDGHMAEIIREK